VPAARLRLPGHKTRTVPRTRKHWRAPGLTSARVRPQGKLKVDVNACSDRLAPCRYLRRAQSSVTKT